MAKLPVNPAPSPGAPQPAVTPAAPSTLIDPVAAEPQHPHLKLLFLLLALAVVALVGVLLWGPHHAKTTKGTAPATTPTGAAAARSSVDAETTTLDQDAAALNQADLSAQDLSDTTQ